MKHNLFYRNGKSHFQIATAFFIAFCCLLFAGCAGMIDRSEGDTAQKPTAQQQNHPAAQVQNGEVTPVSISKFDDSEIEFLPLIPLEDQTDPEKGATDQDLSPQAKAQSRIDKSLEFYQAAQEYWQQGELENAIDSLDKAYALILNTRNTEDPKFIQQKDDLRFMISKRILEIYASRYTTVKGNHDAIPIVMNKHVKKEIKLFTEGRSRKFFMRSYKRSGRYRAYIVEELKKAGLPEELSWLPLIESGFKTKALSSARALGMWQFIASTGYKFGLKRDRYIDERLDPYKSTQAAIGYLKELHEIFGDWKTVLAAYNCGEGRVLREIRKQNINYLDDFWDLFQQLPYETARYVPKFIATLHIINNMEKYGMDDVEVDDPIEYKTVEIDKQAAIRDIADALEMEKDELLKLNPELRYKMLPDETYALKVPPGKKEMLLAKIDDIEEFYQSPHNISQHRVRPGETLSMIADRYNTTVKKITWYNNIYRNDYIIAGQVIKIPRPGDYAARGKPGADGKIIKYKVQRGDSLWVLAKRYNTTTKKIQALNNLKSVNLHIGQTLNIPTGNYDMDVYHVKRGDSPFSIAKKHDMGLKRLLNLNQLSKNSRIYPGQKLYVE